MKERLPYSDKIYRVKVSVNSIVALEVIVSSARLRLRKFDNDRPVETHWRYVGQVGGRFGAMYTISRAM